jgi:hypothetical protein
VDENGMLYTDSKGVSQFVSWQQIEKLEVSGGRLQVSWQDANSKNCALKFGARELENGMELIQLLAARGQSTPASDLAAKPTSNFIPLEPK